MRPYRNESLMEEIRATEAELEEMERRRDQRRHSEIRRREDELQDLRRRQDETARRQEARLYAQATNYGSSPASYERRSVYMEESSYHMERERRASSRQHVPGGTNMSRHSGYDSAGMERPSARQIPRQSSYDHAERERGSATRQFPTNTPGHSTYASTERETPASAARQVPANTFTPSVHNSTHQRRTSTNASHGRSSLPHQHQHQHQPPSSSAAPHSQQHRPSSNNPRSQHQHQEGSSTIDVEGLTRRLDNLATSGDPVFSHDIRPQTGPSVSSAADREDAAARPNARRTGAWVGSLNENANFEAWEEGSIANAGVLRGRASGLGTAAAAGCAMEDSTAVSLRGGGGPAPPPTNTPASTAVAELPFPVFDRCAWGALRARDRSLPLPGSAEEFGHPDELDTDVWVGLDNPAVLSVSSAIIAKYLPDLRDVYDRRPGAKFRLKNDDDPYTPRYGVLIALDEGGGLVLQPLSRLRSHRGRLQVDDRTGKFKKHFVDFVRALHGREVRDVDGFRVGMSKTARYFDCSEAISRCLRTVEARQRPELEAAVEKEACDYMHFAFRYDSKPTFKLAFDAVARQALAGGDVEDFLRDVPNATRDIVRIKVDMLRRNIEDDAIWQRAWNAIDGGHPVPSEPSIR
ncbi:hypothetical protein UCDDS831_g05893 [Diplodia seriata]|uniref:Uncharacterized protein n=1 Tax=Diplodia seriata TaxID=420778 RepID=A0A0G2E6F5_9PEZI|nr:hypothetical protein UCDDS831_g05893 [Diplodia seriata]